MAILKKIENNELYLYMNEKLIYKRWLDTGQSKVFDITAYNKYTQTSMRDIDYIDSTGLFLVEARLKLRTSDEGGRKTGFRSGLRPNHVFEYDNNGQFLQTYIGDIIFEGQQTIEPGEETNVTVRFIKNQPIENFLSIGRTWWIHEGNRIIGEAQITNITGNDNTSM